MNKFDAIGKSLMEIVEEAKASTPITKEKQYPNNDPIIKQSRDLIAMTILRLIVRDPRESKAFRLGLVDEYGHVIKEPSTKEQEEALNAVERLAFTLRAVLGKNKARALQILVPKGGIEPSTITPNFLVVGHGIDRGSVEKYLERMTSVSGSPVKE